jgi:hypothetical protein
MDIYELHQAVIDGHKKALQAYVDLKKQADSMNLVLEALKELATEEFQNEYGGKEQSVYGATVSVHRGGRYDYSGVSGWKQAKDKITLLEKQAQLAYKAGGAVVDEETGELTEPAKYLPNKESITVKFPK